MKANRKWLKANLILEVKKRNLDFLVWNLGKFPFFDGFLDLVDFSLFDFPNLEKISIFLAS